MALGRHRATGPVAVGALYLLVALIIGVSLVRAPGARLLGDTTSDAAGVARGLWLDRHVGKTPFTITRDAYEGAPEGVPTSPALTIVEPVQPAALWSLSWLLGDVASINLFLLLAFWSTAFGMFLLCRRLLRLGYVAATTAGFAAAFNPWSIEQALAGHLAFTMLWPLIALLAALAFLDERRSPASGVVVGLVYGAAFLTAAYVGLLATGIAVAGALVIVARTRGAAERLWLASLACIAVAVAVAMLLPGLIAYVLDHSATARIAGHGAATSEASGIWPQEYLNPAPYLALLGRLHVGSRSLAFGAAESIAFFGYSTLILAAAGAYLLWRRRVASAGAPHTLGLLALVTALVAFVASMPPHLVIGSVRIPLPSDAIGLVTSYYRVYSRFSIVFALAAIVLAAFSIDLLWRRARWAGALCALVVIAELWPGTLPSWSTRARPVDRWLSAHAPGIVADYPQPTDSSVANQLALTALAYQPKNGDPSYTLISGGTGGTREAAIRILSRYLTDAAAPGILAAEHVRYVLVHDDAYRAEGQQPPTLSGDVFRLVGRVGAVRVYRLRNVRPADLAALLDSSAASIAAVEGLQPPTVSYAGFGARIDGWRSFHGGARIELESQDPDLKRVQLVVHVRSASATAQLQVLDSSGAVVGGAQVPPQDTQVTLGPFPLPTSRVVYTLRVVPAPAELALGTVLVQPLADYSVSLANR